jgi:hypothetical protein
MFELHLVGIVICEFGGLRGRSDSCVGQNSSRNRGVLVSRKLKWDWLGMNHMYWVTDGAYPLYCSLMDKAVSHCIKWYWM